ncbi:MAG: PQQ-binding-like beta-propeller repeat protein [Gemmataceae bacterium]
MSSARRLFVVVISVGVLSVLTMWQAGWAQKIQIGNIPPPAPPQPIADDGEPVSPFTDAITLAKNNDAPRIIAATKDLIAEENWADAVRYLQALLNVKEDAFLEARRQGADGKETIHLVSIRAEANRLIGTLPPDGLRFYELQYGPQARLLLAEAKAKADVQILAEVAQRYLHTDAGAEATSLLGTYYLDRGRYLTAALCYERLLSRQGADQVSANTLFKAALAYFRAGDKSRAEEVWQHLKAKTGRDGLVIANQVVKLDDLRQELEKTGAGVLANQEDWLLYRGDASRSAQGHGGPPFLEPHLGWPRSTLVPESLKESDKAADSEASRHIEATLKTSLSYLEGFQQPILPGFHPITGKAYVRRGMDNVLSDVVIYRSYDGIYARALKTGELAWNQRADGSLHAMSKSVANRTILTSWHQGYQTFAQDIFFSNTLIGTLSSDGQYVYYIDDIAVPPSPQYLMQNGGFVRPPNLGSFQGMYYHSKLQAVDVLNGKLVWELGGPDDANDLNDSLFLGAPLPLGGKLYMLVEKKGGELNVVCVTPPKAPKLPATVDWTQKLGNARDPLATRDILRRIHACQLAYADGILVCPTNTGAVLGLDLLTRSLVWAHSYRDSDDTQVGANPQFPRPIVGPWGPMPSNMQLNTAWKGGAPIIQDGKVILAAADAPTLHCINLRDGQLLWKHRKADEELYVAGVFKNRVVIVGKNHCRALDLNSGSQLWRVENTGLPSGQGVASEDVYYLPIQATADSKEPAVIGIHLARGVIQSKAISRKKFIPGNLVFYQGEVISQGVSDITVYPQLQVKLAQIDERLKENPSDPLGLTERAELRLDKGDLQGALDDLHTALDNNPPDHVKPKAHAKLYETLTEFFQRDFNASEKYLDEYRALCVVDIPANADSATRQRLAEEQLKRQANFLCLLAKGREQQGRLVDAFQAYMDFGALVGNEELISVIDEPTTRAKPDVWARDRIATMMAKATPAQRQPLEEKITQRWNEVRATNDLNALRKFVSLFGSTFATGRASRLVLAERLMQTNAEADLRDAQMHLLQLVLQRDDRSLAGQAVETLARLMLQKGMMEEAAHYYRKLGNEFAEVVIRDGKTGADFYSDLATDKRFLPYLEDHQQVWNGSIKAETISGQFPLTRPAFTFEPDGEVLPFFQKHRLALEMNNNFQLRVIDQTTGEDYWRTEGLWTNRQFTPANYLYTNYGNANIRHTYRVMGHIVILNLGYMVYALDPVHKKKLWEYNLYGSGNNLFPQQARIMPDRDGKMQIIYQDGWTQKIGQTGPAEPSYVCLLTRTGLVALDPVHGHVLWEKSDVSPRSLIFGDYQHVYLVETTNDGTPTATRALRASDGVTVEVPPFAELYQRRLRVVGRNLLLRDTDAEGKIVLRLYDVHTGQDLWQQSYPSGSVVMNGDDDRWAGVVEPSGKITVVNLTDRQDVFQFTVNKQHVDKLQDAYLLQDDKWFYFVLNVPPNPQQAPWGGGPWANVAYGMRSVKLNGSLYAVDRVQGNMRGYDDIKPGENIYWRYDDTNQMVVLDQFQNLPIVICTARYNQLINNPPNRAIQVVKTVALEKSTGKSIYNRPQSNNNQFYALNTNLRSGTIELVSYNLKIQFSVESGTAADARDMLPPNGGVEGEQLPVVPPPPPLAPQPRPGLRPVPIQIAVPQQRIVLPVEPQKEEK